MAQIQRFIDAQSNSYKIVLNEIQNGRKRSHWIWYFFPQIAGLGKSSISRLYSINSKQEVFDYLDNEILFQRLVAMTQAVIDSKNSISEIFGFPDDLKFISCMTLFSHYSEEDSIFREVLKLKNNNEEDELTMNILQNGDW